MYQCMYVCVCVRVRLHVHADRHIIDPNHISSLRLNESFHTDKFVVDVHECVMLHAWMSSVLQCVAVCCSVLQCVAVCCVDSTCMNASCDMHG